ncbi:MAG: malto-oligosyltrehalose trehalohydrolase [Actinobacteria bacterium]|nr:malto-oligosyltrehalose trehalohydrolase [Actinomycetota bacterium]
MRGEAGGWFESDDDLAPGTDYRFALDGGDPLPDPRSRWQPAGVDGPSRVDDPESFEWTDTGWTGIDPAELVIYELHIGTFTPEGTFESAIERLDHVVDLGITAVEVMPVAEFPGDRGWGYDGVDLYAPHHAYGGPAGLRGLVDACHQRGLGVILDVVYNHLGPTGNNLGRFGPYFTDRYETPWGQAVNLDGEGSAEVRRFFIDNALMWLRDYHVDGLRLDATHALFDASPQHFLAQLSESVDALEDELGRVFVLIAEDERADDVIVRPRDAGGYGLDAVWFDAFHHAVHVALTGERDGYYASFTGLTDLPGILDRAATTGGRRLVACLQNHDQIGNRAQGERLSHLTSVETARVASGLLFASPFVPLLFQGEEWGTSSPFQYFTDHRDPGIAQAVTEGRRREFAAFGWRPEDVPDPQDPATFARSKLAWDELETAPHRDVLASYRALIGLRRAAVS